MTQELDLTGLKCPLPVLKLRRFLRDHVKIDGKVKLTTTDPMSQIDIPHFCNETGQLILSHETTDSGDIFIVQKKAEVITPGQDQDAG